MNRKPAWPSLLVKELDAACARPFVWGKHDCALFACDTVKALTGTDPAVNLRGRYHDARGAMRVIASYGGLDKLAEKIAAEHGCAEISPSMAWRGDVCLIDLGDTGMALGICAGDRVAAASTVGIWFLPMVRVMRSWAVGH